VYQSAELVKLLAKGNLAEVSPKVLKEALSKITEADQSVPIYDYENPVACPSRSFDNLPREVSADLLADIER